VCLSDSACERLFSFWYGYQVDVIGHQAPCQEFEALSFGLFCEYLKVVLAIDVGIEDVHRANAALNDVVWMTRQYDTCNPRHINPVAQKTRDTIPIFKRPLTPD